MVTEAVQAGVGVEESQILLDLAEKLVHAKEVRELAALFLEGVAAIAGAAAAVLSLKKTVLPIETFFEAGLAPEAGPALARVCGERLRQSSLQAEPPAEALSLPQDAKVWLYLFPIVRREETFGVLGILKDTGESFDPRLINRALNFFGCALNKKVDELEHERTIKNLNTYMNISSMIAQALDLKDVLEAVLYFCMDSFGAEAASVLLLDYERMNFRFYSAEGPAKPVLFMASFPADHGLAGAVLASQQAEVINDVQTDPRFFKRFDQESGFVTKNMMAIPLTAAAEKIGVLQILNKFEGDFLEEELLFLQTIAEEIAFAIRNAKLFEVVVKSYCKIRQGESSCRGCKRPLGSWTPCVKYREEAGLLT
uniref:GAF domain-containing protein n=1 Tax=Desulfobacca acetoxidans TaxID=60893 RepID=A0A7C3Z1F2_9BACT